MNMKMYFENAKVGDIIKLFNRDWTVCHIEGDMAYLGAKEIKSEVEFGDTNTYKYSNLCKTALEYQLELTEQYPNIVKEHLIPVTVNGFTSKVFVPSKEQMEGENGGFDYFKDEDNRICTCNGQSVIYWTSSPDGSYVWSVRTGGYLSGNGPIITSGFRPFICLRLIMDQYSDNHKNDRDRTTQSKPCYDVMKVGNIITFCDRDWVICHIENGKYYLAAKEIKDHTRFGDTAVYTDSQLAKVAVEYQEQLMRMYPQEVQEHLVDVTVNGVTAKVFVPSKEQMDGEHGGFSYFDSNEKRTCTYNRRPYWYWTSSLGYGCIGWCVTDDGGNYGYDYSDNINGFRPCICFKP